MHGAQPQGRYAQTVDRKEPLGAGQVVQAANRSA